MHRVWRPVFAQPSSFSVGQRLAERALSLQPGSKLAVRQGFEFYERPHLTC